MFLSGKEWKQEIDTFATICGRKDWYEMLLGFHLNPFSQQNHVSFFSSMIFKTPYLVLCSRNNKQSFFFPQREIEFSRRLPLQDFQSNGLVNSTNVLRLIFGHIDAIIIERKNVWLTEHAFLKKGTVIIKFNFYSPKKWGFKKWRREIKSE